jgi:hypothetical protein
MCREGELMAVREVEWENDVIVRYEGDEVSGPPCYTRASVSKTA